MDVSGGGIYSEAKGVSADCSVVVGRSVTASGEEVFRWTGGVMVGLGDLAGGSFGSLAYDTSSDGSVVVGYGSTASGIEAFVWDQTSGCVGPDWCGGEDLNQDGNVNFFDMLL